MIGQKIDENFTDSELGPCSKRRLGSDVPDPLRVSFATWRQVRVAMFYRTFEITSTVVSPNNGTQIREFFPYLHQKSKNFANKGMSKFALFGQKSCENRPIF